MSAPAVVHTSFVIERDLPRPPRIVFRAWSDPALKRAWITCIENIVSQDYTLDFRVGGAEIHRIVDADGVEYLLTGCVLDIVEDARIIYAYELRHAGRRLSVSLVTVEFRPDGDEATRMVFTEQLAFLDGYEDGGERRHGTNEGFDRLALLLRGDLTPQ
jgi:uncharacterized protein YndB with AHSA1/START domain